MPNYKYICIYVFTQHKLHVQIVVYGSTRSYSKSQNRTQCTVKVILQIDFWQVLTSILN